MELTESILDGLLVDMDQDDTGLIKYSEFVAACLDDRLDEDGIACVSHARQR